MYFKCSTEHVKHKNYTAGRMGNMEKWTRLKNQIAFSLEKVCLWLYVGCDSAVSHISREITPEVKKNISGNGNRVWS